MKIGFTGTQAGMTQIQKTMVERLIKQLGCREFHHGDCIGADENAHRIALKLNINWITIHPPDNPAKRAFCLGNQNRVEKPYIARNHDIVNETDLLIATPGGETEQLRSGTWSTIRFARKNAKRVIIIYPGGRIDDSR